jgi:hypothetical protein
MPSRESGMTRHLRRLGGDTPQARRCTPEIDPKGKGGGKPIPRARLTAGRGGDPRGPGDPRAGPPLAAQLEHAQPQRRGSRSASDAGARCGPRADQPLGSGANAPLAHSPRAHPEGRGDSAHGLLLAGDAVDHQRSTEGGGAGIVMQVHPAAPGRGWLAGTTNLPPDHGWATTSCNSTTSATPSGPTGACNSTLPSSSAQSSC